MLSTQPLNEDASEGAVLVFRLIGWLYHISKESVLEEKTSLPNNMLDNYQACLTWYEKVMKQQEQCSFIQYVPQDRLSSVAVIANYFGSLIYHFGLLVLFRPFFHVVATPGMSPAVICAESCEAILSLAASSNSWGVDVQSLALTRLFILAAVGVDFQQKPLGG